MAIGETGQLAVPPSPCLPWTISAMLLRFLGATSPPSVPHPAARCLFVTMWASAFPQYGLTHALPRMSVGIGIAVALP